MPKSTDQKVGGSNPSERTEDEAGARVCGISKTQPDTQTRGRRGGTTERGTTWTGIRPTRWPDSLPEKTPAHLPDCRSEAPVPERLFSGVIGSPSSISRPTG
jgi:hypothetical protein